MIQKIRNVIGFTMIALTGLPALAVASSFICAEPGGRRLVEVDGNNVSLLGKPIALHIDDHFILDAANGDRRLFYFDGDNVQPGASPTDAPVRVTIATFDGDDIRHGRGGEVMMNYKHPELCPTAAANRVYSIEGDALDRKQLVAGLYLLKPEMFTLNQTDTDKQLAAIKQAGEEQDKIDRSDQLVGNWMVLNNNGIMEKLGQGSIVVDAKKGDANPVTFDYSKGDGPKWTGVGISEPMMSGEQNFFIAYGTPKTVGLCAYEIDGGTLKGKWSPWYIDGNAKNTGTETLEGPASLDGDFKITAAAAPTSGAAYAGTVAIHPMEIVGTVEQGKPYSILWTIGTAKIYGIGIKSGNHLYVASGAGPDICIAKYNYQNGSMNCDWFKLGSTEKGGAAITKMN